MARTKNIVSQSADSFAEDTLSFINRDLIKYREDISIILSKLERWDKRLSSFNKELYLKEAYAKIMEFRTFLLGRSNQIQYRLYIKNDKGEDLTNVQIVNINEQQLMTVVNRDRASLRLKQNLDAVKEEQNKDFKRQEIFNKHMGNIQRGFEHPSRSPKNYVVTRDVIDKYSNNKNFLSNIAFLEGNKIIKLKLFNRGWIYQAFDATVESFEEEKQDLNIVTLNSFHKKYFTESLGYDNIVGFKGGDVGLVQIKANMAALMSKTTLIKYLKIIQDALDMKIKGQETSINELSNYLVSQFKKGEIDEALNEYATKKITDLLSNLTK